MMRNDTEKKQGSRGDTDHLQHWREYFAVWKNKYGDEASRKGMPRGYAAKECGIAYRHAHNTVRPEDPPQPSFPLSLRA
jgi:hypothetical protein